MQTLSSGTFPCTNTTFLKFKGVGMGGIISPDQRACKCGGKFIKQTFRKQEYYSCDKCESDPTLFRVRRYLPGPNGTRGRPVEIRYDQNGKRLRDIDAARATMKYVDGLIESGKFDPLEFATKDAKNIFLFENFINEQYLKYYEKLMENGEYKPSSMAAKKQYHRNHLIPLFQGRSIKSFHDGTVDELYANIKASHRMKDLVAQEFRTCLNYAKKHKLITEVPNFPKMKRAKLKDPEKFLTYKQQQEVIRHIEDPRYKAMITILCLIAIRPSEVRALKWKDVDFKKEVLWIQRHVTYRSIVVPGRKSNDDVHVVKLTDHLKDVFNGLIRSLNKEDYIFKGDVGDIVSEHCLSRAWSRAIKKAGLPHVDLYRGSKSSRMSQMYRAGKSKYEISEATGLSIEVVDRYAQTSKESLMNLQDDLFSMEG